MTSLMELRAHAREIFMAGVKSADPVDGIKANVRRRDDYLQIADRSYRLSNIQNILVVKYGYALSLERIKVVEAGHPIPDEAGVDGAHQIIELVRTAGENDLVLFLISGGGSALLPAPADGLTLAEKQRTTQMLLQSGATIQEVNAVRKHISKLKGGRFAKLLAPASCVSLILSDVIGDSLEAIASGPTVADSTTYGDCLEIVRRYDLTDKMPHAVVNLLRRGAEGAVDETPKPSDAVFHKVQNVIIGSNRAALNGA